MMSDAVSLIADIGGTNMRFALVDAQGRIGASASYPWPSKPALCAPALDFMKKHGVQPRRAAFACANAQPGLETIRMVNVGAHDDLYTFTVEEVRQTLGLGHLEMMNDFAAVAQAVPHLGPEHLVQIGPGEALAQQPIGILGAGTGLGCASLVCAEGRYRVVSGEGGHVTIGGTNLRECQIIDWLHTKFTHVSAERLLCGPGMMNIHEAIRAVDGLPPLARIPADILTLGLNGQDAVCREVLDVFCSLLGSIAGNLALILAGRGGVYIGGGIPPRMIDFIRQSAFRAKFSAKGRYVDFLEAIPTYVITHPSPGLLGAAIALQQHG